MQQEAAERAKLKGGDQFGSHRIYRTKTAVAKARREAREVLRCSQFLDMDMNSGKCNLVSCLKLGLRISDFLKYVEQVCGEVGFEARPVGGSPRAGPAATAHSPLIHLGASAAEPPSRSH